MMKRPVTVILLSMLLGGLIPGISLASWLIYHKPAFKGRVIDAETKEPIKGAVVVAAYQKSTMGVPHRYSTIIKVKETLTDKQGEFYIPSYTTLTQPLSWSDMVTFTIYKPGYGNFPKQHIIPSGLTPIDEEVFFTRAIGSTGKLEMWSGTGQEMRLNFTDVTFGVVELRRLQTKEERLNAMPSSPGDTTSRELPLFFKSINEERRNFGLGEVQG